MKFCARTAIGSNVQSADEVIVLMFVLLYLSMRCLCVAGCLVLPCNPKERLDLDRQRAAHVQVCWLVCTQLPNFYWNAGQTLVQRMRKNKDAVSDAIFHTREKRRTATIQRKKHLSTAFLNVQSNGETAMESGASEAET